MTDPQNPWHRPCPQCQRHMGAFHDEKLAYSDKFGEHFCSDECLDKYYHEHVPGLKAEQSGQPNIDPMGNSAQKPKCRWCGSRNSKDGGIGLTTTDWCCSKKCYDEFTVANTLTDRGAKPPIVLTEQMLEESRAKDEAEPALRPKPVVIDDNPRLDAAPYRLGTPRVPNTSGYMHREDSILDSPDTDLKETVKKLQENLCEYSRQIDALTERVNGIDNKVAGHQGIVEAHREYLHTFRQRIEQLEDLGTELEDLDAELEKEGAEDKDALNVAEDKGDELYTVCLGRKNWSCDYCKTELHCSKGIVSVNTSHLFCDSGCMNEYTREIGEI